MAIVILQLMKSKWLYWVCQLLGWFGMVTIETVNYTFFIARKFSPELFWTFITYAIAGLLCTHMYRYLLKRSNFFQKKAVSIWLTAFLSTIIISALISMISFVPALAEDATALNYQITFIDVAGTIINWMRYVGVWIILYFMYKILQQNSAILREKLTVENLAKTTELELLKTQLNPHFLFNALNSIKALVIINPQQSREAIVKLSELLRFTLQYGKKLLIPVNDEMKEVKKYLELEQLRFGERLQVAFCIDENTLSQTIPPAIVLTLAENAIKHGVARQMGEGHIMISSSIVDDKLNISVANAGLYQPGENSGIGLKHVQKRLEEVYHNKADFTIPTGCNCNSLYKNAFIMAIKTLLVDDEPLALAELQTMLRQHPDLLVADTAADAREAVEKIHSIKPQLIFLDINMPGKSGFDMLEELDAAPHIIFVTAYDQFAIKAFEVNALDYILKPVNAERLTEAIEKVKRQIELVQKNEHKLSIDKRIFIKDGDHCFFVPLSEVVVIESVGNYARIYYENKKPLLHKSLNYLEEKLPDTHFFRADRQHIININFIKNIFPHLNSTLLVEMQNGTKIEISQRQSVKFKELMGV